MGGIMFIPSIIIALLIILAGLVAFIVGLVGWIILKLMKEEIHLNITTDSDTER